MRSISQVSRQGSRSIQITVGAFTVAVRPFMTALYWSREWLEGQKLLAWVDDAHPTPVVFRWSEAVAIARNLESETHYRPRPSEPSLALLLLVPFVRVTSFDDVAGIEQRLHAEIGQLGLFEKVQNDQDRMDSNMSHAVSILYPRWDSNPRPMD